VQVHAVQFDTRWEDKPANFQRARELIEQAAPPAGGLIALPEMFATGFTMKSRITAEPVGGETEQFVRSLARETGCLVIAGVVTDRQNGRKPTNDALICSPRGGCVRQGKLHPFSLVDEQNHHSGGGDLCVAEFAGASIAPLVCYDLRFPEAFRALASGGANVFVVIANWPASRSEHWLALLRARAIENHTFVVGVNRTGVDPNVPYSGDSAAFSPLGDSLARADASEQVLSADLDPAQLREARALFCSLDDIRDDLLAAVPLVRHSLD
jgi:omega-amidase